MSDLNDFVIENGVLKKYTGSDNIITIPDSVTSIGDSAFILCTSLQSVVISDSVTNIADSAFHFCTNLQSVVIPHSVISIGDSAFEDCESLTSITIPGSITSIGEYAFAGCTSLKSITIPDSVTSIGDRAFGDCKGLANKSGFIIIRNVLHGYFGQDTHVTVPDNVTSIGKSAFNGCTSLTSIAIDGFTYIDISAFKHCTPKAIIAPNIWPGIWKDANLMLMAVSGFITNRELFTNKTVLEEYETYALSQRRELLPEFFKNDLVSALEFYANSGKITVENFEEDYWNPALKEKASQCTAFLLEWKNRNISQETEV